MSDASGQTAWSYDLMGRIAIEQRTIGGVTKTISHTYFANRNVNVETNGRDNGRTATYTYDALNRVSTASSQATSGSDCWGQSFGYDRYANLTTINVTQCTAPMLSLSVNTNNQITNTGFTYDADGDLTGDGTYTYSWNAEQHLKSAASVTYTYDGDLRRVEKSSGTLYWYCATCGNLLEETDASGNIISEYALFNRQRIARRDISSGNVYYLSHDRLGSHRTLTDSSGNVKGESDYYPFGAERVISSTVTDNFRFTRMESDPEDGLDHTLFRQYTPAQGRWETPDPVRGDITNPQSLNRYVYALDAPTTLVDPLGLIVVALDASCSVDLVGDEGTPETTCSGDLTEPEPTTAGPSGGSGGGSPLSGLLAASVKRILADLQKPNCAKDFESVGACQADLNNIGFKAAQLNFTTTASGSIVPATGEWVAESNSVTGSITLNSDVNWVNPNQTGAFLNGQPWTYQALYAEASLLGLPLTTNGYSSGAPTVGAADFMDITILHELAHLEGNFNPDKSVNGVSNEVRLWNDCIK